MRFKSLRLLVLLFVIGEPSASELKLVDGGHDCESNTKMVNVVTTFSVLSDLVKQVGGARVNVHSLIGMDENAHVFQPTPIDVKKVAKAGLLVVNGLGFEGWLDRLVLSANYKGKVLTASDGVDKILLEPNVHHDEHTETSLYDPHAWHSLNAVKIYVKNIAQALQKIDGCHAGLYQKNKRVYLNKLAVFQTKMNAQMAKIVSDRHIVMPHNAFAYLARDYNLHIHSLQGLSAEAETSAAQIASIIRQVRKYKISAIFAENISDQRLINIVRRETGVKIGGALITGALSQKLAPTYLDMMAYNLKMIVKALKTEE